MHTGEFLKALPYDVGSDYSNSNSVIPELCICIRNKIGIMVISAAVQIVLSEVPVVKNLRTLMLCRYSMYATARSSEVDYIYPV